MHDEWWYILHTIMASYNIVKNTQYDFNQIGLISMLEMRKANENWNIR